MRTVERITGKGFNPVPDLQGDLLGNVVFFHSLYEFFFLAHEQLFYFLSYGFS